MITIVHLSLRRRCTKNHCRPSPIADPKMRIRNFTKNGGRSAMLQNFPRGRSAMKGGRSAIMQTFPLGAGRSAMLQIFRGKVCNVADLPGGKSARGKVCNTTPAYPHRAWAQGGYSSSDAQCPCRDKLGTLKTQLPLALGTQQQI